jgi:hypothetical protein
LESRPDAPAVPIPEPLLAEWASVTVEFEIVKISIIDVPPHSAYPVPIPEPYSALLRAICELEINKAPMEELPVLSDAAPVPIPEPDTDRASITVEFQIVRLSTLDVALHATRPHPIPEPS